MSGPSYQVADRPRNQLVVPSWSFIFIFTPANDVREVRQATRVARFPIKSIRNATTIQRRTAEEKKIYAEYSNLAVRSGGQGRGERRRKTAGGVRTLVFLRLADLPHGLHEIVLLHELAVNPARR